MSDFTLAELCAVACAEAWRGDGEILASPIGVIPAIGARLAQGDVRARPAPDRRRGQPRRRRRPVGEHAGRRGLDALPHHLRHRLVRAPPRDDGRQRRSIASATRTSPASATIEQPEGAAPRHARRARQHHQPPDELLDPQPLDARLRRRRSTSCRGVGYDRARRARAGGARFHEIRRVVTNMGVLRLRDARPRDAAALGPPGRLRGRRRRRAPAFRSSSPTTSPTTRAPTAEELRLIREVIDPTGAARQKELERDDAPRSHTAHLRAVRHPLPDRPDRHGLGRRRAAHRRDERRRAGSASSPRRR